MNVETAYKAYPGRGIYRLAVGRKQATTHWNYESGIIVLYLVLGRGAPEKRTELTYRFIGMTKY
jgi:hypothetical protein